VRPPNLSFCRGSGPPAARNRQESPSPLVLSTLRPARGTTSTRKA